jgi:hypothetical protein
MRLPHASAVRALPVGFALALTLVGGFISIDRNADAKGSGHTGHVAITRHYDCPTPALKAAPTGSDAGVGCRTMTVEATADGRFVMPRQVEAGRTLITFRNGVAGDVAPEIVRLPAGKTVDDVKAAFASPESVPDWFFQAVYPGSPGVIGAGGQSQAIVDLSPGEYVVFSIEAPERAQALTVFTADQTAEAAEPEATATVTVREFAFALPATLKAGKQVWKIVNNGEQAHEVTLAQIPDGTTIEQIQTLMSLPEDAERPEGLPDPSAFVTVGGLGFLSPGQAAWSVLDLEPGTYAAFCYVPDQQTGMPHAFMGMILVFTVST